MTRQTIEHTTVNDSSTVSGIWYNHEDMTITVGLVNGKNYTFYGKGKEDYEAFASAPSKGRFFNEMVRQNKK